MKYRGKELILDNFRSVLYDSSIDIQDIVRSAILDGVDISQYIASCKDNPYRLDQIRLSMKEDISSTFYKIVDGGTLYQIRQMRKRGINLTVLEKQLSESNLNEEYMRYMLSWVNDGINISKLNIAIIPKNLLDTFDYALRSGFDVSCFNNGVTYSPKYVRLCLPIMDNGKSVSFLLNGEWSLDCLSVLGLFSKVSDDRWNALVKYISSEIKIARLEKLIKLVKSNIDISKLQTKNETGYNYPDECLDIVYEAFCSDLDYNRLIKTTNDPDRMRELVLEMEVFKRKKVSGRMRKN